MNARVLVWASGDGGPYDGTSSQAHLMQRCVPRLELALTLPRAPVLRAFHQRPTGAGVRCCRYRLLSRPGHRNQAKVVSWLLWRRKDVSLDAEGWRAASR